MRENNDISDCLRNPDYTAGFASHLPAYAHAATFGLGDDVGISADVLPSETEAEDVRAGGHRDVLVAIHDGAHFIETPNPVLVLSRFKSLGATAALLRKDGEAQLIVSPAWDVERAKDRCPSLNVVATDDVVGALTASLGNGSGDAQGSERGLEYDTMSGRYAEFVEQEVLPLVESKCNVKLTKDPEGRATMGGSSGGSACAIAARMAPNRPHPADGELSRAGPREG